MIYVYSKERELNLNESLYLRKINYLKKKVRINKKKMKRKIETIINTSEDVGSFDEELCVIEHLPFSNV